MLDPVRSSQFKRDVKRVQKRGKDMNKLRTLLRLLIEQAPLPEAYQDHLLRGDWKGYRDAHIDRIGCCCIAWLAMNFIWHAPVATLTCSESN